MQMERINMQHRQFGNTDMRITPVGFGAWALGGGDWVYSWGPQDDQESKAAIYHALDRGINWIDTAAGYGLGHSEVVVGQALKGLAERPYIYTKCSLPWNARGEFTDSLKRESIRRECEDSLRRLQLDTIDLYQIHWPRPDEDIEEGWAALAELQREGKIRWLGVSNFSVEQMNRAQAIAPINTAQPPYSLIRPEVQHEILPYCQEHNIGVIVYSPMYSGLLSGKMTAERIKNMPPDDWRQRDPEFQMPRLAKNLNLVAALEEIGGRYGVEAGAVAIAWTLRHPAVTGAIVGARRPSQVDGILPAAVLQLSTQDIELLKSAGFAAS